MKKPLEFAPLTIFCGANSSGKSSILQSILLFKQTLQKRTLKSPNMALNGPLVKLGGFSDVVSDIAKKNKKAKIPCAFRIDKYRYDLGDHNYDINLEGAKHESSISCEVDFTSKPRGIPKDDFKKRYPVVSRININNLQNNDVNLTVKFEKAPDNHYHYHIITEYVHFTNPKLDVPMHLLNNDVPELSNNYTDGKYSFDNFLPEVTPDNQDARETYTSMQDNIRDFFLKKVFYLGPLRSDPQDYNSSNGSLRDVGCKGEYTAECYLVNNQSKNFVFIGEECFSKNDFSFKDFFEKLTSYIDPDDTGLNLGDSVNVWMDYICVAEAIKIGGDGELRVIQEGRERTLNNVGVGVSQVLPIIVQCLVAEPGSTIIIEQPELHLHPKMQSRLADFFLVMSSLGRQLVIETHSEYIIDKLRLRIVQAPLDRSIDDKIAIYFAEKHNGSSEFKKIEIDEFSVMSEWPEDFFEESISLAEEIFRAARQKDQEWRENNKDTQNDLDDEDYDD
jgi:AAA15 family ATPase/GTPase